MFDVPNGLFNWLQIFFSGCPYSHVRVVVGDTLVEMTSNGVYVIDINKESWDDIKGVYFNRLVYQMVVPADYLETFMCRVSLISSMNLKWSLSFVLDYLFTGSFSSLNCVSMISWILTGKPLCDTPEELTTLLEKFHNDYNP
jgi:hypothetical protein